MKKLFILISIFLPHTTFPFQALLDYCFKNKEAARRKWVEQNIVEDLEDIGIKCSQEEFAKLNEAQRAYLQEFRAYYIARGKFQRRLGQVVQKAEEFPEPFKQGLKDLHKTFGDLKTELLTAVKREDTKTNTSPEEQSE